MSVPNLLIVLDEVLTPFSKEVQSKLGKRPSSTYSLLSGQNFSLSDVYYELYIRRDKSSITHDIPNFFRTLPFPADRKRLWQFCLSLQVSIRYVLYLKEAFVIWLGYDWHDTEYTEWFIVKPWSCSIIHSILSILPYTYHTNNDPSFNIHLTYMFNPLHYTHICTVHTYTGARSSQGSLCSSGL